MRLKTILILALISQLSVSYALEGEQHCCNKSLKELQHSIQKVLNETHTAGAGIVVMSGDTSVWIGGVGKADKERNISVNENTMFRLGSLSKMMVSLAILKLQEEGRLNLKDKVSDIIPEIGFDNPWEKTNPVRIEHLLEHTSGWSYWHMAELGSDDPKPKTLKEALDFYPRSRKCRYIPGTRQNESNVGIAVAAYIVEKISGMTFENYMDKYFFKPMGVEYISFYKTAHYHKAGAALYENGVKLSYFNILYRPAAAMNASPKDFAKVAELFINRGVVNGKRILSESSISRMERSESMGNLSKTERFKSCGLSNYAQEYNGFTYHGFGGSLPGANSEFNYLPENKMGFAVMINDGNEEVVKTISELVMSYQTENIKPTTEQKNRLKHKITANLSGYYTCIEGKIDILMFIERIKNIQKVWIKGDTLFMKYLLRGNSTVKYTHAGNNEYIKEGSNKVSLLVTNDPLEGQIVVTNNFYKKISPFWAYTLITLEISLIILVFTSLLMGLIGVLTFIAGKKKNIVALKVALWPMFPSIFLLIPYFIVAKNSSTRYDIFTLLGMANLFSVILFACSICFALASGWSAYYIFKNRHVKMSRIIFYHSVLATAILNTAMVYLLCNGIIGIPTWI